MKKLAILLMLLVVHSVHAEQFDEDEVVWVEGEDPVMIEAIQNARKTLDGFLQKHSDSVPSVESYKLKVMLSDSNGTEHFWVTPFRAVANGRFEGVLANEPQVVRSVSYGQVIEFDRSMISDWGYVENGKQIGSYTICALFKSMPKEQVEYYEENHGFVCE